MSDTSTLNSRLRVLIAKTFRAEKLYGSMRNAPSGHIASAGVLSEMANDIRAREWQRSHTQLRTGLNDILALGANSAVAQEIARLRDRFRAAADESNNAVEHSLSSFVDTAKRHEFLHSLKMSFELIRHKARAQANHVIAEELAAVLQATGRGQLKASAQDPSPLEEELLDEERKRANESPRNVIQFKTRLGKR